MRLAALSNIFRQDTPKFLDRTFDMVDQFQGKAYLDLLDHPGVEKYTTLFRKQSDNMEYYRMREHPECFEKIALAQKLAEGFTLAIRFANDLPANLKELHSAIKMVSGQPDLRPVVVACAKNRSCVWDPQPFLMIQVQGTATWQLSPPMVDVSNTHQLETAFAQSHYGTIHQPAEVERVRADSKTTQLQLQPKDGLLVPVGWLHERLQSSGLSIHLVLQEPPPAGAKSFCD